MLRPLGFDLEHGNVISQISEGFRGQCAYPSLPLPLRRKGERCGRARTEGGNPPHPSFVVAAVPGCNPCAAPQAEAPAPDKDADSMGTGGRKAASESQSRPPSG